jgi:transcriptional regulator with XRE-family HTH domain
MTASPTARRRRLGIELRRLREAAGMRGEEVGRRLKWSVTKVSRIETGRVTVHHGDVADLLDVYGVNDEALRSALITLARQAREKGWWHIYGDVIPQSFEVYVGLESAAANIRMYQPDLIPGVLQTEEYARAVMRSIQVTDEPKEIERRVELRMARQERFTAEKTPGLWLILDEAVLHREVGGAKVMGEQLQHLARTADDPRFTVQVLPVSAGSHIGMDGRFVILEFPEHSDLDLVYIEYMVGALYLDREAEIRRYNVAFDHLRAKALDPDASFNLITQAARELELRS